MFSKGMGKTSGILVDDSLDWYQRNISPLRGGMLRYAVVTLLRIFVTEASASVQWLSCYGVLRKSYDMVLRKVLRSVEHPAPAAYQ